MARFYVDGEARFNHFRKWMFLMCCVGLKHKKKCWEQIMAIAVGFHNLNDYDTLFFSISHPLRSLEHKIKSNFLGD